MTTLPANWMNDLVAAAETIPASETTRKLIREIIHIAGTRGSAPFVLWDLIDENTAKASAGEKAAWHAFRKRFEDSLMSYHLQNLQAIFTINPLEGWQAWTIILIEAFSFFRDRFCAELSSHPFTFPANKAEEIEAMHKTLRLIAHGRWGEVYDHIQHLSNLEFIPVEHRSKLLVILGQIDLYLYDNAEKAKGIFEQVKQLIPQSERVAHCFGEYWLKQKNFTEAEACFKKAKELNPYWPVNTRKIGEVYEGMDRLQEAERWYKDTCSYDNLLKLYGHPKMFKEHQEDISRLVQKAIDTGPEEGKYGIYISAGYCYDQNSKFNQAMSWYDKAINLDATRLEGYISKGYCYISKAECEKEQDENYTEAQHEFQKAIELAPEAFDGYWGLSIVHEKRKQWEEAIHQLEESKKRRPASGTLIIIKITGILWEMGRDDEAIEQLKQILHTTPRSQEVLNQFEIFANDYKEQNQPGKAAGIYEDILQLYGEDYKADYHNRLGNLKYYNREYEEAAKEYRQAAEVNPEKPIYQRNLSEALKQLKDWEGAKQAMTAAKNIDTADGKEEQYNQEMSLIVNAEGNDFFSKGRFQQAIEKYKEAISYDINNDIIFSNLAKAWENIRSYGKPGEALMQSIEAYTKAYEKKPTIEYSKAIERLIQKQEFIKNYGEVSANRTQTVSPIIMEVAADLISYFEGEAPGSLSPGLSTEITALRNRIATKYGIKIPHLLFRGAETYFTEGSYLILIDEVPLVTGYVNKTEKFAQNTTDDLLALGIRVRTNTTQFGNKGCWVQKEDWEKAAASGIALWDIMQYAVHHLEAVIQQNLANFTGHQEVSEMLSKETSYTNAELKKSPEKLSALVAVCRGLVSEQVPLIPFGIIYKTFDEQYEPGKSLLQIVETIRSLPEVSRYISECGNKAMLHLSTSFEEEIQNSLYTKDGHSVLAMGPQNCQDALEAVKNEILLHENNAFIVTNSTIIRPFVKKLIETEFPNVSVLSRSELLPGAEPNKIAGCIELNKHATAFSTAITTEKSGTVHVYNGQPEYSEDAKEPIVIKVTVNNLIAKQRSLSDEKPIEALFDLMHDVLFYELGLLLPPVQLVMDEDVYFNEFHIQIGNTEFPLCEGLLTNEFLVNDTPVRLARLGIKAKEKINPANGRVNCIVNDEGKNLQKCKDERLTVWGPIDFIVFTLAAELRRKAPLFQTIQSTRYSLSLLETVYPDLITTSSAKFSVESMCRILKSLLEEEISVRNMKGIIEALLSIRGVTDVNLTDYIVFLPVAENLCFVTGEKTLQRLTTTDYANAVRVALKKYITSKYSPAGTMIAYLLEPTIEYRIKQSAEIPLTEKEKNELRNGFEKAVNESAQSSQTPVVLTTLSENRNALQKILRSVLPHTAVLNYQELSANANVQPVSRIGWVAERTKIE